MVVRNPLVLDGGMIKELPAGDSIKGAVGGGRILSAEFNNSHVADQVVAVNDFFSLQYVSGDFLGNGSDAALLPPGEYVAWTTGRSRSDTAGFVDAVLNLDGADVSNLLALTQVTQGANFSPDTSAMRRFTVPDGPDLPLRIKVLGVLGTNPRVVSNSVRLEIIKLDNSGQAVDWTPYTPAVNWPNVTMDAKFFHFGSLVICDVHGKGTGSNAGAGTLVVDGPPGLTPVPVPGTENFYPRGTGGILNQATGEFAATPRLIETGGNAGKHFLSVLNHATDPNRVLLEGVTDSVPFPFDANDEFWFQLIYEVEEFGPGGAIAAAGGGGIPPKACEALGSGMTVQNDTTVPGWQDLEMNSPALDNDDGLITQIGPGQSTEITAPADGVFVGTITLQPTAAAFVAGELFRAGFTVDGSLAKTEDMEIEATRVAQPTVSVTYEKRVTQGQVIRPIIRHNRAGGSVTLNYAQLTMQFIEGAGSVGAPLSAIATNIDQQSIADGSLGTALQFQSYDENADGLITSTPGAGNDTILETPVEGKLTINLEIETADQAWLAAEGLNPILIRSTGGPFSTIGYTLSKKRAKVAGTFRLTFSYSITIDAGAGDEFKVGLQAFRSQDTAQVTFDAPTLLSALFIPKGS